MKVVLRYLYTFILLLGVSLAQFSSALDAESLFKKASPAVVQIAATSPSGARSGTGFFVSADGKLVTNSHVIEGATEITVIMPNKAQFVVEKTEPTPIFRQVPVQITMS